MATVLDSLIKSMKLNDAPDDEYDLDEDYLDDEDELEEERPAKKSLFSKSNDMVEEEEPVAPAPKAKVVNKVTPMKQQVKRGAGSMEVCVIKPTTVEEAREITETLLSNRTVVLNLEGLDVDIAQRIIDFTSGSCYAIQGNLQKISHYIFIITPSSVDISGDFQNILAGTFDVASLNPEL